MNHLKIRFSIKYKLFIMIELTFLKELMLIRQTKQQMQHFSLLVFLTCRDYVSARCLQWMPLFINEVYEP